MRNKIAYIALALLMPSIVHALPDYEVTGSYEASSEEFATVKADVTAQVGGEHWESGVIKKVCDEAFKVVTRRYSISLLLGHQKQFKEDLSVAVTNRLKLLNSKLTKLEVKNLKISEEFHDDLSH